jgi:hypothetical protein
MKSREKSIRKSGNNHAIRALIDLNAADDDVDSTP